MDTIARKKETPEKKSLTVQLESTTYGRLSNYCKYVLKGQSLGVAVADFVEYGLNKDHGMRKWEAAEKVKEILPGKGKGAA